MTEEITQRSPEWYAARLGKATASRIADLMAKTKSGPSASRANYMAQLVCERLTGAKDDEYVSPSMQWGIEQEAQARELYSFLPHHAIPMAGASPDGLVGDDGGVEFKCPNSATHIETLLTGKVPGKYVHQIQWTMACRPERRWWDYVSFDPRLPPGMQLWRTTLQRDDDLIAEQEAEVRAFLRELDEKVEALEARYRKLAA